MGAWSLDGTDLLSVADNGAQRTPTTQLTVGGWIYYRGHTNDAAILCKPFIPVVGPFDSYIIQTALAAHTLSGSIGIGTVLTPTANTPALSLNTWYFVALTWTSGSNVRLDVWNADGSVFSSVASAGTLSGSIAYDATPEPIWVGQNESTDKINMGAAYLGVHNANLRGTSTLDNWRMSGVPGITLSGVFLPMDTSSAPADSAQGQTVTNTGATYDAALVVPLLSPPADPTGLTAAVVTSGD